MCVQVEEVDVLIVINWVVTQEVGVAGMPHWHRLHFGDPSVPNVVLSLLSSVKLYNSTVWRAKSSGSIECSMQKQ